MVMSNNNIDAKLRGYHNKMEQQYMIEQRTVIYYVYFFIFMHKGQDLDQRSRFRSKVKIQVNNGTL